ncbi:hypothetical protein DVA86_16820 [Streptomyces armeniacus]|uniref:Uncharacterized protein n=1 Tax=Streptomyces armeniacus TaxID=83291 RepID=A0A345XR09_9ACTN|nr:hypothetical protein [Streptomyces armeniacus]AXK34075.1 hypothetical protein DVA86_16820 [Streptomyces armeniacus]
MHSSGTRKWWRRAAVVPAGALAALAVTGATATDAYADETHTNAHNGPHVSLISTGQIDDPMEDVLEHFSLSHTVND